MILLLCTGRFIGSSFSPVKIYPLLRRSWELEKIIEVFILNLFCDIFPETTTLCRLTPTLAYVMRITCRTSNSSAVWRAWPFFTASCSTVSAVRLGARDKTKHLQPLGGKKKDFWHFGFPLEAFFIRPFYKMMLQKPIALQDMESVVSAPATAALDEGHRSSSAQTPSLTFVCCFIRTANISTPSSGFWRTTRRTWTWGSPLMKISLDRSVWRTAVGPVQRIVSLDGIIRFCLLMRLTCLFRLTSMNWSRVAQRSSSPMTTRRNTSSEYSTLSNVKSAARDLLVTVPLFASLVMQWRFVNRVLKQMTAFKEVRTSSTSVFFPSVYCKVLNMLKMLNIGMFLLRDSLNWSPKIWSRSLMRTSWRWVFGPPCRENGRD